MPAFQPKIAIIGAGPAGLCLGALLSQKGISSYDIYELRGRPSEAELSGPSGMLDLHEESGLAAIRACGLLEAFVPLSAECAQSMVVRNKEGKETYADEGGLAHRPEISRHNLTRLLLSRVPADRIRWGCKLVSATTGSDGGSNGGVTLEFADGLSEKVDLVVGADGAWSRVRPLLNEPEVRPYYAGWHYAVLNITDISTKHPHLEDLVGRGSCFMLGDGQGIVSQRGAHDSARLYLTVQPHVTTTADTAATNTNDDREFKSGLEGLSPAEMKARLLDPAQGGAYASWGAPVRELIAAACDDEAASNGPTAPVVVKPLCMLPIGHSWASNPAVTLIGDAAHLMLPFAGEGVNLALRDALDLSRYIAKAVAMATATANVSDNGGGKDAWNAAWAPQLKKFETAMFARAEDQAAETWRNCGVLFSEDAANATAKLMKSFGSPLQLILMCVFSLFRRLQGWLQWIWGHWGRD